MHLTANPIDWYAARAAGVAAYVLLTVSVSLGLTLSSRRTMERWPRFALEDVHRFVGLLVGAFVAIHVVTIAIDSFLRFSIGAIVVPFVSTYRPLWTALGIVAAELLLALAVTNHYRQRLPYRVWRRFHYANFAVWGAASVHGIATGTDRSTAWLVAIQALAVATVLGLTVLRLRRSVPEAWGAAAAGLAAVVVLSLVVFPFRTRPWNAVTFHDRLSGVVARNAGPTRELVSVTATGDGDQRVLMRADLLIEPQGLLATSFQLEFLPSGMRCRGSVTRIEALGFAGRCRADDGTTRNVHAAWESEDGPEFSQGTLDASA